MIICKITDALEMWTYERLEPSIICELEGKSKIKYMKLHILYLTFVENLIVIYIRSHRITHHPTLSSFFLKAHTIALCFRIDTVRYGSVSAEIDV